MADKPRALGAELLDREARVGHIELMHPLELVVRGSACGAGHACSRQRASMSAALVAVSERAAVRWLGRFALEPRGVTIDDLRRAADAFDKLAHRSDESVGQLRYLRVARGVSWP